MVASLLLVPDSDETPARIDAGSTSIAAAEVSATHSPDASRSERRSARVAGADALTPRRAVRLDNTAARRGVTVIHERAVQARIEARRARIEARQARIQERRARARAEQKRLAARRAARRAARLATMAATSDFRVGALNILGSQHSAGPGGYGPGIDRAAMAAGLVMSRGVDVLTMSEVQDDQLAVLNNRLAGYSIWPQQSLGSNGQRLQIAWRAAQFEMLDGGSVTFPFDNQSIPLPYVLLRDLGTGAQFWVISTHNSARDLEGERDAATAIQIALMQRLMAQSGKPVIIGGDVNEHEEFFYKVCGATGFLAANGGGAGCTLPPRPLRVDWIMGGGGGGVDFSGYVQDGATLASISDHYFIRADVSVTDPGGTP